MDPLTALKIEFWIATRFLFNKKSERFISLISLFSFFGIALGVATLTVVISVMNGFREKLVDNIVGVGGHISVESRNGAILGYEELVGQIRLEQGIVNVIPIISSQVLVSTNNQNAGAFVVGLDDIESKPILMHNLVHAEAESGFDLDDIWNGGDSIVIGRRMAENLQIGLGDYIEITSPSSFSSIVGEIPRSKDFRISSIFEVGMYEFDASSIFMDFRTAQTFFQLGEGASKIEIEIENPIESQKIADKITKSINRPEISISTWQNINNHFINALDTEKRVMFLILSLIILVAAFNVVSCLIMLVNEKSKSIAILRSFGMSRHSITRIFLITGGMISVGGTILGSVLGVLFSANINIVKIALEKFSGSILFDPMIYFFKDLPSRVDPRDILYIVGFSLLISFMVVIFPAVKASKKDPAEALRYL